MPRFAAWLPELPKRRLPGAVAEKPRARRSAPPVTSPMVLPQPARAQPVSEQSARAQSVSLRSEPVACELAWVLAARMPAVWALVGRAALLGWAPLRLPLEVWELLGRQVPKALREPRLLQVPQPGRARPELVAANRQVG